ncbi:uncharacterized protein PHALS_12700 [Plasmopara halstedii]|uniref:Uncharacterized protein n=1 Tax=Plasmopara halstedii TaxID=4781 RepID=A0A0P1AM55_PLAHL|nr:uncharacterized protein PHALS_12700 [Plasmopara halstedii]CEG42422.1 hypothetical protein PHALS_12700 [Plasmopara halstedii]|eukprot:XP_024578791.1 hypothetical protein PHALS_12700 [Plasmopara halstedii]
MTMESRELFGVFEMPKNYVFGRILTDFSCYPPSCTKVLLRLCSFSSQNYNQVDLNQWTSGISTMASKRRPSLRVVCVMFRTSSASTNTYRLLPGSTLRVR